MNRIGLCAGALALSAFATAGTVACAQSYPSGPIMLVNPYAAGGPADVLARPLAAAMGDILGQQVVILNKPGAATAIAAQHVARAPADGYTLLLSTASAHIVTPLLTPKVGYDGIGDFAFVAMIASVPNVLVVRPTLPVHTVEELVAMAKDKPGALNYGSVGNGSQPHLAAEMFQQMTATKFNHIPYKGAAPAREHPGRMTTSSCIGLGPKQQHPAFDRRRALGQEMTSHGLRSAQRAARSRP